MEFKRYKLGTIAKTSSGATPTSTKKIYYEGGTIPWINSGELSNPFIDKANNYITKLGFDNSSTKMYAPNETVLLAMYGATAGKAALLQIEACTNQAICAIIPDQSIVDPLFLKYKLDTMYNYLVGLSSGSARDNLSQTGISNLTIDIPSLAIQKRISKVLYSLDRKIALNRAINQNLDALAKQLYDYWFVQFDFPNEEGRPYKSSGGKMVWNDALKRHVPSIWSFKNLKDVACFVKDKVETSKLNLNTYISTENMQPNRGGISIASNLPNTNYVTACNCGDIVIANIRPYFKKIFLIPTNGFGCSSDVLCIRANDLMYSRFVYGTLSDDAFFDYVMSGAKGSKMPRGDKEQIMQYPVIVPNKELVEAFNCVVYPIHSQIHLYRKQAESLTKQRDELLPLLMNGQVSLNSDLYDFVYIIYGLIFQYL